MDEKRERYAHHSFRTCHDGCAADVFACDAAEINAEIPKVIEKASPSVVAIIGKPSSEMDKSLEKNRFNLAHGTGVIVPPMV